MHSYKPDFLNFFYFLIRIGVDLGEVEQLREVLLIFFLWWSLCLLSDTTLDFALQENPLFLTIFILIVQKSLFGYVQVFNK